MDNFDHSELSEGSYDSYILIKTQQQLSLRGTYTIYSMNFYKLKYIIYLAEQLDR